MTSRSKHSAGILMYKFLGGVLHGLLVHPGGPFWARRDEGVWSIPKGEFADEGPLEAAKREFREETGFRADGEFIALSPCRQKGGKVIHAWAVAGVAAKINPAQVALLNELQQKLG